MQFLSRLCLRTGRNPRPIVHHISNRREDCRRVGAGGGREIVRVLDEVEDDDDFRTAVTSGRWKFEDDDADDNEISSSGEKFVDAISSSASPSSSVRKRVVENDENLMLLVNEAVSASSAMVVASVSVTDRKRNTDSPPTDDCYPICFGAFVVLCRAPCGHWYCREH